MFARGWRRWVSAAGVRLCHLLVFPLVVWAGILLGGGAGFTMAALAPGGGWDAEVGIFTEAPLAAVFGAPPVNGFFLVGMLLRLMLYPRRNLAEAWATLLVGSSFFTTVGFCLTGEFPAVAMAAGSGVWLVLAAGAGTGCYWLAEWWQSRMTARDAAAV